MPKNVFDHCLENKEVDYEKNQQSLTRELPNHGLSDMIYSGPL